MKLKIKLCCALMCTSLFFSAAAPSREIPSLAFLASPKGLATVGIAYGVLGGISNFLWAFDWTRAGATEKQNKQIQEAGGISCSAESFLFAALIPLIIYEYNKLRTVPAPSPA